jgi:hypothetical protein
MLLESKTSYSAGLKKIERASDKDHGRLVAPLSKRKKNEERRGTN